MMDYFTTSSKLENRNEKLFMQGMSLEKIAFDYGTPVHVLSADGLRENYGKLKAALDKQEVAYKILYAMKANPHTQILRILSREGAHMDCVCANEAKRALLAGVPSEKIMFTGAWNSREELAFLLENGIALNIDSLDDLEELAQASKQIGKIPELISFRVNGEFGAGHHSHTITGGVDSQFGIWHDCILGAYKKAQSLGAKKFGMHVHIGSGVLESSEFIKAANIVLEMAGQVRKSLGLQFEFIDFGGGLGVPYKPEQQPLDLNSHFSQLCNLFKAKIKEYGLGTPLLAIEPGRFLVCDAEIMLAKVRSVKQTPQKNFARTDLSMNDLGRHAMYGSYHHILVDGKLNAPETTCYTITGTICETGDRIATDRLMPKLEKNDLLAILNTGAYGYAMGSEYNSRGRAPIILIDGGKTKLISRRGTIEDVLRHEVAAK